MMARRMGVSYGGAYLIDLPWTERMGPLFEVLPRVVCARRPATCQGVSSIDETQAWRRRASGGKNTLTNNLILTGAQRL